MMMLMMFVCLSDVEEGFSKEHVRLGTRRGARSSRQRRLPGSSVLHDLGRGDPATDAHT